MRVPVSWLREYVDLPTEVTARELAAKLIAAGLEVETVEEVGADISGPIVVGRVLEIEELTGFKKPIRHCRVDVGAANGSGEPQNIICGARNFSEGDLVVVSLPGAELPGGFKIGARKTYGRMSEGMICSASELNLWEDHAGIIVLPEGTAEPGTDAFELLGLREDVLDIAVTPDRGYALSLRGVAREAAALYEVDFRDPAEAEPIEENGEGYPAEIADIDACDRFVLREVSGFDSDAPTPMWMKRRLALAGMRPVSLAVDVTNYVMWELGQPLHAFDRTKLSGGIVVRRAEAGERLETLDHVVRDLDPDDIVISDASGPISLAGTMGGLDSEIDDASTELVIEAAHFSAPNVARMARRHNLHSEASRRFERGVDRELPLRASARAVELLTRLGGGRPGGLTSVDPKVPGPAPIVIAERHAARIAGVDYPEGTAARRLRQIGCEVVEEGDTLRVSPPSWRPDLTDPNDLAEEVIRYEGYENIPSIPPRAPVGRGLSPGQRLRRAVGRALAGAGFTEVLSYPFVGERDLDGLQVEADDARRDALRLANPLNDDEPFLRTTLLPGLLKTLVRNVGRGFPDVALFEMGLVYLPKEGMPAAPLPGVDRAPTAEELAELEAAIPHQPRRVAAVLAGDREPAGWWGQGRAATWADAIEAAREVGRAAGVEITVRPGRYAPWHPGRCAELYVTVDGGEVLVGHAGELHPRVTKAYGLPARTAAMEVDLDPVERAREAVRAPEVSTYPVATQDVALVVETSVPAGEVEAALREGAGELLEDVRLFDVYTGEQVGEGRKSLAYSLRFRAGDRTLTAEEATAARDAAVAVAAERVGAVLRG
ncbi:phenylalanine--tRNA ligase subunit beta [Marinactinospora thermotolerans]|uniref:Phenylalanine--tRNA ligase beta subunit n=1 Tax=Marinactinospora thermotolerans DSM 45154 TaxID=1122192 RepID=A0A1T4SK31_9ACTN|nr:phenylalanine--tRNA ligase subunit beta [Marinactinospora thermotolerans]SKA28536.1 phenylalanyl-tRNA synthetase beta subunit [Marinactinospora thermotolerans DSM 45154]